MLMSAKALLDSNPDPSRDEIRLYMSGNLCRCGSYEEVIEAIQAVAAGEYKE
jgi:carbon-monoxide dehydrogenase small subunit